jgi:YVTN family beta-propeller protein
MPQPPQRSATRQLVFGLLFLARVGIATETAPLSPTALAGSSDGKMLYVACATGRSVLCFDVAEQKVVRSISMPAPPSGLVLSSDGSELFVTCAASESEICVIDVAKRKIIGTMRGGYNAMAPVLSLDGRTLYVCNQFNNDVSVIDLVAKKDVNRIAVQREPVAAALTRDGRFLLVANHLSSGPADAPRVAAVVSVIDLAAGKVIKEIQLPNGSKVLKDIRVSPDGKYAVVTHLVGTFDLATTQVDLGWINANALSIVDLAKMEVRYTLLLDMPREAAANPWGAAWSADGRTLAVAHAGTHELSIINFPEMLAGLPAASDHSRKANPVLSFESYSEEIDTLPYLIGSRRRIALPKGDVGPRSVIITGNKVLSANYFSDTLSMIDLSAPNRQPESIPLGPKPEMTVVRRGESYFNDATICRQGWQSCASCHPEARVDALNWDLLNDGIGNPKNTRSLLLAHKTPPATFLGVRTNAETAVRAGIKFILFSKAPEAVATSIDEYLKSLKPMPSPYLVHGKLSKAAKRGEKLFSKVGCADCHVPGLYTDLHPHDVGTIAMCDRPGDRFYTPTLIEVWRTAPYLHTGSAATMRDVLTTRNSNSLHGNVSGLSNREIDDLCEFVLSL